MRSIHSLPWLDGQPEAASIIEAMASCLGTDWRAKLESPDWMQANTVAQPLLTGIGIAAWQMLAPRLPAPAGVAGYSVGELAAFAVAGVFKATVAIQLATARAQAMNDCVAGQRTGMLASQGPNALALAEAASGVSTAIRVSSEWVIVGGTIEQLDACAAHGAQMD